MALGEARLDHTSMVESHSWLFVVTLVARLLHALLDKSICISIKFNKSNFYCKYNYTHLKKVYIRLNKSWTKLINLWTILQYIYKIIWSLSLSLSLSLSPARSNSVVILMRFPHQNDKFALMSSGFFKRLSMLIHAIRVLKD